MCLDISRSNAASGKTYSRILPRCMLAYLLLKELGRRWAALDVTVEEGLKRLNTYGAVAPAEGPCHRRQGAARHQRRQGQQA